MVDEMRGKRVIALDTESDSLFSYYPKVCLIQISAYADGDGTNVSDYLVDPLAIDDLAQLGELLSVEEREVVMHAAENDLLLLQREYGISVERLFDTQLAARILGKKQVGLASILDEEFGVASDKRMQRTNWGSRPLKREQIVYAQKDTHFLLPLRERLSAELKEAGRWEEAQDAFELLVATDFESKETPERTMWQMKETRDVPRESTGVLEALWEWRELEAQRRNTPPFKILGNRALAALAEQRPATLEELGQVKGVGASSVRRYGNEILDAIRNGQERPLPELPEPSKPPEYMLDKKIVRRYDALRKWRTRTADSREVDPDIVMANSTLLEIAKRAPDSLAELQDIREVGAWKANKYGPAILGILKK